MEKTNSYRLHGKGVKSIKLEPFKSTDKRYRKDVIRSHQAKVLWEKHRMSDLKIFRDTISVSFENQVLAT